MAHKSRITAGFVTVCCFMSMVSKTSCSNFTCQGSYYTTHTLGLNFTIKSWAESLALMSVIMHGPYLKRTQLLCVIWRSMTICEQPALVCHGSQSRFHRTWICFSNFEIHSLIYDMWPQADIHTYIHTYTRVKQCSHASVGLAQVRPNNSLGMRPT